MEDCNMLAVDCIVISSCCQCLILQIIIFIFLKLPYKLVRKTKYYAMKKLRRRSSQEKTAVEIREMDPRRLKNEFVNGIVGESMTVGHDSCEYFMKQVEVVLEDLSSRGEFAFGSFWGRRESEPFPAHVAEQEFDASILEYHLIEMLGSLSYS
ncbi:hypothetical protein FNV43_RR26431 [Rhamnella rubrinervis]|uniref:Uncharacterized protein n=1 Tax=Rhamnella rubrinervis TaxID=2594499 RepID=A0A8K0DP30_9ROSA|nr:hypothetical protein FNV43_RR26431 [Rhamnella rubrinervis]